MEKPFSSSEVGGLSPRKLRSTLLGVEKKMKEEEDDELDSTCGGLAGEFRGVNVVRAGPDSHNVAISRARSLEEEESAYFGLEFQKMALDRDSQRPPFSKPVPSKWDDAQKWLASPNSTQSAKGKKAGVVGHGGGRAIATKVVVMEDVDTKRIDPSQTKKEIVEESCTASNSCARPPIIVEKFGGDSTVSLSQHNSSATVQGDTTFLRPPSTVRSVSMRDMGTDMTPIASQEPSCTGTPVRATTPTRGLSPTRISAPGLILMGRGGLDEAPNESEVSDKELQMRTRREIMILGTQLGKANIAAWASREEEEHAASTSHQNVPVDQPAKSVSQTCAVAWEEAESAKYTARFKQEEVKIQARENHQKAKTEAEIRKIEDEVERMKARAHEKLMEKLAAARLKVEEKRAAAEAKRNQQAARTRRVEHIRSASHIPSSFCCWAWCS